MDEDSLESSSVPAEEFGSRRKYAQKVCAEYTLCLNLEVHVLLPGLRVRVG